MVRIVATHYGAYSSDAYIHDELPADTLTGELPRVVDHAARAVVAHEAKIVDPNE